MSRPAASPLAVLGSYERLYLHRERRTMSLVIEAPIAAHATAIMALGSDAETRRSSGHDPEPHCTVAMLPVPRPVHPVTDEIATATAALACIEALYARGDLRAIAPELEERFAALAKAAREDILVSVPRRRHAQ